MSLLRNTGASHLPVAARFTRSALAASAAATMLLGALLAGGAGSASAYAATHRVAAPAGVTWHRLSLLHGWKTAGSFGTGFPSWAVQGGVVYLSGSVRQISGNDVEFTILPKAARPAHMIETPVYTYGDTSGWLEIYPTGQIYANSDTYSNAQSFTSLAGLSWPTAGTTVHKLRLINGWRPSHAYWDTAPSYTVHGGMVYLSGAVDRASSSKTTFGVLPKAARPAHVEYLSVATWNGVKGSGETPGDLKISPGGGMLLYGHTAARMWLGDIAFPVATARGHKLTLINGWNSEQSQLNTGNPSYSVSGGVVHLSGSMHQPTAGADFFATLPAGARPKHQLYIRLYADGFVGTLYIRPNGTMQAYSPSSFDAQAYASLAAVSFPVNS